MSNRRITIDFLTHNHDKINLPSKNHQKTLSRKKQIQNKYENECIHIQLMDEYPDEYDEKNYNYDSNKGDKRTIIGCSWDIPRKNLKLDVIQNFVNRSQDNNNNDENKHSSVVVAYIRDSESGAVILPNQMMIKCKPKPPSYYIVVNKQTKITYDVLSSTNNNFDYAPIKNFYNGDTKFFLQEVPCYSGNGLFEVQEQDIAHWIIIGLLRSDIDLRNYALEANNLEERLERITQTMEQNAYLPVYDEKGLVITGKKADEEKELRYQELFFQKEKLQQEYDDISETFRNIWKRREEALHVDIVLQNYNKKIQKKDYIFEIDGAEKERYERIAVEKEEWGDVPLVAGTSNKESSISAIDWSSIRNFDLNNAIQRNYSDMAADFLVDIIGIEIKRIKDGFGMHLQQLTNPYYNNNVNASDMSSFDFYHGLFRNDQRSGFGSWYTEQGMYMGGFLNDQPNGRGTWEYSTGDKLAGEFHIKYPSNGPQYSSFLEPNPYLRGLPNGEEKHFIQFADGSMYEGTMENGVITGEGVYINSLGERIEGTFDRGILVKGKKCMVSSETLKGEFIDGNQLDGYATIVSPRYSYQGYFDYGDKHGKGTECFLNQSVFQGFYFHGSKTWRGEIKFGKQKSLSTKNENSNYGADDDESVYKFKYNGPWLANHIISGGFFKEQSLSNDIIASFTPKQNKLLQASTNRFTNIKFPSLAQMIDYEHKSKQNLKQKARKYYQHDRLLRKQVILEHKRIFDMQLQRCISQINDESILTHKKSVCLEDNSTISSNSSNSLKKIGKSRKTFPINGSLPDKRQSYYNYRQLLHGPRTLRECEINPGLRLEVKSLLNENFDSNVKLKQVTKYAKSYGIAPSHHCALSEMIQCNFGKISFKWKCIDINYLKQQVLENYVTEKKESKKKDG